MVNDQQIYTGPWVNNAHGSVVGATLTLRYRHGAYLIAFLALFVHVAGACLWRLICYGVFQQRAHPDLHDCAKLQEQMILRTSPSSVSGLRYFAFLTARERHVSLVRVSQRAEHDRPRESRISDSQKLARRSMGSRDRKLVQDSALNYASIHHQLRHGMARGLT